VTEAEATQLRAEVEKYKADAAGAAALRLAFCKAASEFPAATNTMSVAMQVWWGNLYDAIVSTSAGMGLLGELARLKALENT
jgi:hypothetical protein